MKMQCPVCESENVVEINNLSSVWQCFDCGREGDGSEFDVQDDDPFCWPAVNSGQDETDFT